MQNISEVGLQCVGCRSCEQTCPQHCISMKPSQEGFLYPEIDNDFCTACGLCLSACPFKDTTIHRKRPDTVWAFRNMNDDIMISSSGGAADVIAKYVLSQDGAVFGAAYDDDFKVKHLEVTDDKDRIKLQSSKYVQSDTNNTYGRAKEMLISGKMVLFTGTPCQISGLYAYLKKDYPNLYTIDLVCHGVPSPMLFEKYLKWQCKKMKGDVIYFNFRSKDKRGWGTQYLIKTKTKTKTKTLALDKYGKHFLAGDCYRESCYSCPYANMERVGDITVGDFWGVTKSHPDFFSDRGVSSVFINTTKGKEIFEYIKENAEVLEISVEDAMYKNDNLSRPSIRPVSRDSFYKDIDDPYFIDRIHVGIQLKERIKAVLPKKIIVFLKKYL